MKKTVLVLAGTMLAGTAHAAGWADLEKVFPAYPCQDGWMACLVDGAQVNPDLSHTPSGLAAPADMRVGWDMQPTAVFSPFATLSAYTGQLPVAAPPPASTEVASNEQGGGGGDGGGRRNNDGGGGGGNDGGGRNGGGGNGGGGNGDAGPHAETFPTSTSTATASETPVATTTSAQPTSQPATTGGGNSMVRPTTGAGTAADAGSNSMVRPTSTSSPTTGTADASRTTSGTPQSVITPVATTAATPAPADNSCDNRSALEPVAALGKLSAGQVACLESAYSSASKQTDKDKVSRVLMANAWGKGDSKEWERLAKRHLDEIDQSDADLCFKYAMQLNKGGAGRANGVIKWSNVALDNRTVWTGQTYQDRVAALYKLRTSAAQSLWKKAETDLAANPGDDGQKKADDARNQTKVFAREWYEFLKASSKDTTTAMQVCIQAAGTKDYCEGS